MTILHVEPVLLAAQASIRQGLEAALAAVAVDIGGPHGMVAPPDDLVILGMRDPILPRVTVEGQAPQIEVAVTDGRYPLASVNRVDVDHAPRLAVAGHVQHADNELLHLMQIRLGSALLKVLMPAGALGTAEVTAVGYRYLQNPATDERDSPSFTGSAIMFLDLEDVESI